jgi:hypothetical protein
MAIDAAGEVVLLQGNTSYSYLAGGLCISGGEISATAAVPQYAIDSQGDLYTLIQGTLTDASTSFARPQTLATGVTHMAMNPTGGVTILQGPHTYSVYGGGLASTTSSTSASYALDDAGTLYTLQGGTLSIQNADGTTSVLATRVTQMAMNAGGAVVVLQGPHTYSVFDAGIGSSSSSVSASYLLDGAGCVYTLQGGTLTLQYGAGAPSVEATGITQLSMNSAGAIVALQGPHAYSIIEGGVGGQSISPGTWYALDSVGDLYALQGGTVTVQNGNFSRVLATGVSEMFTDRAGTIVLFKGDGTLWEARGSRLTQLGMYGLQTADGSVWYLAIESVDSADDRLLFRFSGGDITSESIMSPDIARKWLGMGGPSSALGLPTSNVNLGNGFKWQNFRNGVIYSSASTGAHAIMGNPNDPSTFWGMFAQVGFEHTLGLPTSDAYTTSGDTRWGDRWTAMEFQKGSLCLSPGGKVSVYYAVDTKDPQVAEWDCGASSSARLLRWYGWDVSGSFMRSTIQASGDLQTKLGIMGATPQQYASAMQTWMPSMQVEDSRSGIGFQRILDLLGQGKPLIALLRVGEKEAIDGGNATTGAIIGGIVAGPVGAIIGAGVGAADQHYKIPLLHYVLVNQVDYNAGRIGYIDPAGAVQRWMSFADFQAAWNWTAGGLPGTLLKNNDVHACTIIHA